MMPGKDRFFLCSDDAGIMFVLLFVFHPRTPEGCAVFFAERLQLFVVVVVVVVVFKENFPEILIEFSLGRSLLSSFGCGRPIQAGGASRVPMMASCLDSLHGLSSNLARPPPDLDNQPCVDFASLDRIFRIISRIF